MPTYILPPPIGGINRHMRRLELLIPVVDNFGEFQWKDNAQTLLYQYVTASAEAIENGRGRSHHTLSATNIHIIYKKHKFFLAMHTMSHADQAD